MNHPGNLESADRFVLSPAGGQAAVIYLGSVRTIDLANGRTLQKLPGAGTVDRMAFSHDGRRLAYRSENQVEIVDLAAPASAVAIPFKSAMYAYIGFSADDQSVYVLGARGLPTGSWKLDGTPLPPGAEALAAERCFGGLAPEASALSPDGQGCVLTATGSTDVEIRDAAGRVRRGLSQVPDPDRIAVSPDGRSFANSASKDGSAILLWNADGSLRSVLPYVPETDTDYRGAPVLHRNWALAFSPDGSRIAVLNDRRRVIIWDTSAARQLGQFRIDAASASWLTWHWGDSLLVLAQDKLITVGVDGKVRAAVAVPGNAGRFAVSGDRSRIAFWTGNQLTLFTSAGVEVGHIAGVEKPEWKGVALDRDGTRVAIAPWGEQKKVRMYRADGTLVWELKEPQSYIRTLHFSADGATLLMATAQAGVRLLRAADGALLRDLVPHQVQTLDADFSADGRYVVTTGGNGLGMWNIANGNAMFMAAREDGEWIDYDAGGLFNGSRKATQLVGITKGLTHYAIDQFALRFNRPDLLLRKMELGTPELIELFHERHLRRLQRAGVRQEDLDSGAIEAPSVGALRSQAAGRELTLAFRVEPRSTPLASYNVYVNDVPLFGAKGKPLDGAATDLSVTLTLSVGDNRVEASCTDRRGSESPRRSVYARYDGPSTPELHVVAFGVSKYADASLNLGFADKDARDLGAAFAKMTGAGGFAAVHVKTFTNEEVTVENLRTTRALLAGAGVDDTFVLFIAGHGVHDRDKQATYYFLTHGANVASLRETAADFELIEEQLQGVAPRRKLFLMDTCESGEAEEAVEQRMLADARGRGIKSRGIVRITKGAITPRATRMHLLQRENFIFNDLVRRSGAIVFSSSRGGEMSYESPAVGNGYFTRALLEALVGGPADVDANHAVSTDELRDFVGRTVAQRTFDLQHPTVDRDNLYQTFSFPVVVDSAGKGARAAPPARPRKK